MKVLESSSEISLQVLALKMLVHPKYSFFDYFFRQGHFYPFIQTLFNKSLRYVLLKSNASSSSLYNSMRNSDEITIGKKHPTLFEC